MPVFMLIIETRIALFCFLFAVETHPPLSLFFVEDFVWKDTDFYEFVFKDEWDALSTTKKETDNPKGKTQTVLLNADTITVNIEEKTSIQIDLNQKYNFIDLQTNNKPKNMEFDISEQSFDWWLCTVDDCVTFLFF